MSKKSRKKNAPLLLPSSTRPSAKGTRTKSRGATASTTPEPTAETKTPSVVPTADGLDLALPIDLPAATASSLSDLAPKRRSSSPRRRGSRSSAPPRSSTRPTLDAVLAPESFAKDDATPHDLASAIASEPSMQAAPESKRERMTITPPRPTLAVVTDEDDISIPPAPELDEGFFADGERASRASLDGVSDTWNDDIEDPRVVRRHSVAGRARRAKLTKYVQWSLAFAAMLCFAAGIRGSFGRTSTDGAERSALAATPMALAVAPPTEVVLPSSVEGRPFDAVKVAAKAEEVPPVPALDETPAPAEETAPVDARAEKKAARVALEKGAAALAIASAKKSVDADGTDAEAWLLLGAAYQETGRARDARQAFQSCAKEAKVGPISECRALLSSAE
ncbi:MAG: tetratricopeptide repeat protein [Polyangiaceae bacterium]